MIPFPMPNDALSHRIVIASTTYIDDQRGELVLVLLLEREPPYFTVALYATTDFDPTANPHITEDQGPAHNAGDITVLGRHENIVPAVREYEQSGGDY